MITKSVDVLIFSGFSVYGRISSGSHAVLYALKVIYRHDDDLTVITKKFTHPFGSRLSSVCSV